MDILKIIKILLKHWMLIGSSAVAMFALVFVFTINLSRKYESSATIYTGINTGVSIDKSGAGQNWATQSALFDNFQKLATSRETLQEVGLRLFASHLTLKGGDPQIISQAHWEEILKTVPATIQQLIGTTSEQTYDNIVPIADTDPYLIGLINYPRGYYSFITLQTISMMRSGQGDMVDLSYVSNDPGVSQKTLEILINVCIRNFRNMSEGQVDKVVNYYEEQMTEAQRKLNKAEDRLLAFKKTSNLVDATEQTTTAIRQRDDIIAQIDKEKEAIAVAESALKSIEAQMGGTAKVFQNQDISQLRERLAKLENQITMANLNLSGSSTETIQQLEKEKEKVKSALNMYMSEASSSPIAGEKPKDLSSTYFTRVVAYEESKARLKALVNRRDAVMRQYAEFVPLGDTLNKIQRERDISEKEYLTALANLNDSKRKQQDQRLFSNISIIDQPNYPLTAKSTRKILLIVGFLLGGLLAAAFVIIRMLLNTSLQNLQRAEKVTGLDNGGGIIPDLEKLKHFKNAELIANTLNDTILRPLYLPERLRQQQRVLILSIWPGEGKSVISKLLCERLTSKGRKCLVVAPVAETGTFTVVSFSVNNYYAHARATDIIPIDKPEDADVLLLELPALINNDYPLEFIKHFNMAFLICRADRAWSKADQVALDNFISISGIQPHIILNMVAKDTVEDMLGKIG